MKTQYTRRNPGFTLIELLVAMAITTIIVTILVSITSLSLDTWNRNRSEIRAARQGKAMLDTMASDFESMVSRNGNNFEWLYAESAPSTDGPKKVASPNSVNLFFLTAASDRYEGQIGTNTDAGGDISGVSYELAYKDPIDGAADDDYKTFVLYRKLIDPDDTFTDLLGETSLQTAFEAAGGAADDEENFICENVFQFTITFHVDVTIASGNTQQTISVAVPVGQSDSQTDEFSITGSGIETTYSITNPSVSADQLRTGRVSAVEISLTVLTDFGMQQMRRRSISDDDIDDFIAQNSYQYSKLIPVPGS
ncbi:type II secretion system protein J [Luteolibacter algae]|uniref:Type II secretion system protein J n=1 Tax=Luteolibacter algae TaxID=454151 RepID=A0ABW5D8U5_9BACT